MVNIGARPCSNSGRLAQAGHSSAGFKGMIILTSSAPLWHGSPLILTAALGRAQKGAQRSRVSAPSYTVGFVTSTGLQSLPQALPSSIYYDEKWMHSLIKHLRDKSTPTSNSPRPPLRPWPLLQGLGWGPATLLTVSHSAPKDQT